MLKRIVTGLSLLAMLLTSPSTLSRAPAAPYGERVAASDAQWAEARPDPTLQVLPDAEAGDSAALTDADNRESVARLENRVRELEALGGPYAYGLEETLADLARQQVDAGRLGEALSLYRRSLHIMRVNAGLASPGQMAVVRTLLQLQRRLGDRAALDDLYGYYYRLGWLGVQGERDETHWRVALEYLRWQRERLRLDGGGDIERDLLRLHQLNDQLLEQAATEGVSLDIQTELVRSQLRNLYLVQDRVSPAVPETFSVLAPARSRRQEMLPEDIYRDRLLNLQRSAVVSGSGLLASLAERVTSPVEQAALYREMGDWEQWNGSWHRAEEAWRRAVVLLGEAGEASLIDDWFGAPVELPDNGVFWQPESDRESSVVRISFDVNARGRPRRAEALLVSGRDSATILALRELRSMRFRPAFSSGQASASEGLAREYRVYH